ncbi:unnamed protein product [Malus baccata var. baccata]
MASTNDFPVGYKFHPRDEELVGYYLRNKVRGAPFKDENVIPDIDLYGGIKARDIWNNNGGQNLGKGGDLYFFTKLKPTSSKGTGSRVARTIGSGTWHGQNSGTKVKDPKTKDTIGWWKRTSNGDDYVVCRIRKNYDRKRKADDREETKTATTGFANQPYHFVTQDQSNYFVADPTMASSLRMASREDYLQHNGFLNNVTDLPQHHCSNAQPSSCTVLSHYDLPQTATTGFANQPHHFVTQDQPNYFVADSTMDSSLLSPGSMDQNYSVMNDKDQLPLPNFDYSQLFYEDEGDHDIMIGLDDLWNDMVQPAAVF